MTFGALLTYFLARCTRRFRLAVDGLPSYWRSAGSPGQPAAAARCGRTALGWLADLANAALTARDYLACYARVGSLPLCCAVNHFCGASLVSPSLDLLETTRSEI